MELSARLVHSMNGSCNSAASSSSRGVALGHYFAACGFASGNDTTVLATGWLACWRWLVAGDETLTHRETHTNVRIVVNPPAHTDRQTDTRSLAQPNWQAHSTDVSADSM